MRPDVEVGGHRFEDRGLLPAILEPTRLWVCARCSHPAYLTPEASPTILAGAVPPCPGSCSPAQS